MQHKDRSWRITSVISPFELATQLTEYRHCLCQGFRVRRYLFLNDSEDDQQANYAVCLDEACGYETDESPFGCIIHQIETREFTFLSYSDAWHAVNAVLSGRYDFYNLGTIARQRLHPVPKRIICNQCLA